MSKLGGLTLVSFHPAFTKLARKGGGEGATKGGGGGRVKMVPFVCAFGVWSPVLSSCLPNLPR